MDNEQALIMRAQAGDATAFAALYRAYAPRIVAYCRARTPTPEDAEDATQATFCSAWAAIGRYRDRGAPLAHWLLRIAHNAIVDCNRKQRAPVGSFPDNFGAEHLPDDAPTPDEVAARRLDHARLAAALSAAIAALPPVRREVILGRFGERATTIQLAQALRITPNHIRVHQHRALRQLKKALAM